MQNIKVTQLDLVKQYHSIKEEIDTAIESVLESDVVINGKNLRRIQNNIRLQKILKNCVCLSAEPGRGTYIIREKGPVVVGGLDLNKMITWNFKYKKILLKKCKKNIIQKLKILMVKDAHHYIIILQI